jgi:choline kinase
MILFRGQGPMMFRDAIEKALRDPSSQMKWYLSVIDEMARKIPVWTCLIDGLQWCEIDYRADLKQAEKVVSVCGARRQTGGSEASCRPNEISLANP